MRIVIAFTAALLSACSAVDKVAAPDGERITVEGITLLVNPEAGGYHTARDTSDRWMVAPTPPHLKVAAIEKATGCDVDQSSVRHLNAAVTQARVLC